jgi:hypothetical protein
MVFGTTLERLWPQTPKNHKKISFRGTFFGYVFDILSHFPDACFLTCFVNLSPTNFLRQRHPRASISNAFGRHLVYIWNKCEQLETAILCRMVLKNQALEGLCFTLFCHFHVQVFGTSFFHDSFYDLSPFYTFVHPLEAPFLQYFAIISTIISKHVKNRRIGLALESR